MKRFATCLMSRSVVFEKSASFGFENFDGKTGKRGSTGNSASRNSIQRRKSYLASVSASFFRCLLASARFILLASQKMMPFLAISPMCSNIVEELFRDQKSVWVRIFGFSSRDTLTLIFCLDAQTVFSHRIGVIQIFAKH